MSSCQKNMFSCLHVEKTCLRALKILSSCLTCDVSPQNTGQYLRVIFGIFVYQSIPKISLNHLSNHVHKLPIGLSNRAMALILLRIGHFLLSLYNGLERISAYFALLTDIA